MPVSAASRLPFRPSVLSIQCQIATSSNRRDHVMKLVFIGASHWHLSLYLDPALEVPGAQVVGISDPDPGLVASLSEKLGCVGNTAFRALCRGTKPDFVFALGRPRGLCSEAHF